MSGCYFGRGYGDGELFCDWDPRGDFDTEFFEDVDSDDEEPTGSVEVFLDANGNHVAKAEDENGKPHFVNIALTDISWML